MRLGIQMINFNKLPQSVDGAASRTGKISGKGCPSAAEEHGNCRTCLRSSLSSICEFIEPNANFGDAAKKRDSVDFALENVMNHKITENPRTRLSIRNPFKYCQ